MVDIAIPNENKNKPIGKLDIKNPPRLPSSFPGTIPNV